MIRSELAKNYEAMQANIKEVIFDTIKKESPVHRQIYNIRKMTGAIARSEGFSGIGYYGPKNEEQAGAIDKIWPTHTKSWVPTTYSMEVKFSSEAIADDEMGVVKRAIQGLTSSAVCTQDVLCASTLNTGFDEAGYDGKPLFAVDHGILMGMTWRNRPIKGMALTRTTLQAALIDWMNEQKNSNGQKIEINPRFLVTSANLMFDAREILKSVQQPDSANNALNIIKSDFNLVHVMWKRLVDPKAWYLLAKPEDHYLSVYEREPLKIVHGVDDEEGFAWSRGEFRMAVGASMAQGTYASPGH